jgi:hypothetical protein
MATVANPPVAHEARVLRFPNAHPGQSTAPVIPLLPSHIAPRGVWRAHHFREGHAVAQAITSAGYALAEVVLVPGIDRAAVREWLEELLNEADPTLPRIVE